MIVYCNDIVRQFRFFICIISNKQKKIKIKKKIKKEEKMLHHRKTTPEIGTAVNSKSLHFPPACCITFGTASVALPPPNPPSIPPTIPARAEHVEPHIAKNPLNPPEQVEPHIDNPPDKTVAIPLGIAKAHKLLHALISPLTLPFKHVYGIPQQHI
jgi:hypothetical protein